MLTLGPAAEAVSPQAGRDVVVSVIEVSGLIDAVVVDFVTDAVGDAERARVEALVIRIDSPGSVVDEPALARLSTRVRHARIPVAVWVGDHPSAVALGGAFEVLVAADIAGAVPRARVGDLGLQPTVGARDAVESGLVDFVAPTLGDFIVGLDGRTAEGEDVRVPTRVVRAGGTPHRELAPGVRVGFDEPALVAQVLHGVATPTASYLLTVIGLFLLVFEFFTAGVAIAGGIGALTLGLGAYGIDVLPARPLALALLAVAAVGIAIDLQAGAPRAWTVIGLATFVAGSMTLFDGTPIPLLVVALVTVAVVLTALSGMPAMIRTRFSTPTIGREWMVGEAGLAVSPVDPDGTVEVRSATWRARTSRATPIATGAPVRVVAVDGVVLEVEPVPPSA